MATTRPRRCYYEVLQVPRDVSADELKRVYRSMALKYHPDKNREQEADVANQMFQEIQQAYEVLSDPQERAWYDAHREAILHWGGLSSSDPSDRDGCIEGIDLYPFFSSACYDSFEEEKESNFYSVYNKLFNDLYLEDQKFGLDDDLLYPSFGHGNSEDHVWQNFYAFFTAYITPRSYSWLDEYDTRVAENRRVSRLMERENKKVRDAARKERNELVRNLVKFVKKRDPRVKAFNARLEARKEENKDKSRRHREKQLQERAQMLNESRSETKLEGMDQLEEALDRMEVEYDSEEENFCVVCNKQMRNAKAYEAHLKQKKHLEMLAMVKEALVEEDIELDQNLAQHLNVQENDENEMPLVDRLSSSEDEKQEELDEKTTKNNSQKKKKGRRKVKNATNTSSTATTTNTTATTNTTNTATRKNKKGGRSRGDEENDLTKTCVVCHESFGSKNKLFAHLKATNHQTFVPKG